MESTQKRALYKIVSLGNMGVGKTSLINSYQGKPIDTKATIGNEIERINYSIRGQQIDL